MSLLFAGLDVSKATLDLHLRRPDRPAEARTFANPPEGTAALAQRVTEHPPTLLVVEATGGYERAAVAELVTAGVPVAVVNPRQVRDFARATGRLASAPPRRAGTDPLDAEVLALFAERVRPEVRPLPTPDHE